MTRPVPQPFPDFEILGKIGSGSMGAVFLARQLSLDRLVALKVLKPSLSRDRRYVERLSREARLVARLDHPNIVHAYDLRQEKGYHFFVMEYVEGRSLRDLLKDWGRLPEEQVLRIGIQVGLALEHARKHGVIHRDIKPANILVQEDGNVKLADLGLAKGPEALSAGRQEGERTLGTPLYMSPEQARDPGLADIRSDIYSLGATLFHAACGVPPFQGNDPGEVLTKVLHSPAPSPRSVFPGISPGLDLLLRKCLLKDPDRRYQAPMELVEDLKRVQATKLPAVDAEELETGRRPRKLLWGGLALLAAGLAAVLVFSGKGGTHQGKPAIRKEPSSRLDEVSRELRSPRNSRLIPLIRSLRALEEEGEKGAIPLLARAHTLFNRRLSSWLQARLEGLRKRLEAGKDLSTFPQVVGRTLDEAFLRDFGVPPKGIPDRNTYAWFLERKKALLEAWKDKVARLRTRTLQQLAEAEKTVREKWAQVPERAFRKRLAIARGILGSFPLPDLPAGEMGALEEARKEVLDRLEEEVNAQAENLVRLCRSEVLDKEKNLKKRIEAFKNSPQALGELLDQVGRLRSWLVQVAPRARDLPPRVLSGGKAWSKELLLGRLARLEKEILEKLRASDRARVEELSRRFRHLLRKRDYEEAKRILAKAGVRTPRARAELERMARELQEVLSLEEAVLSRIRELSGREGTLLVEGARYKVRFQVCRARPGKGFLLVEDERGKPLKIDYARIRRSSLVDLLPPEVRRKRRKAVVLFLLAGDEVDRAREEASLLKGEERKALLARVEERAGELRLPFEKREARARRLFGELKKKISLGLHEEALHIADELIFRYWGTQTVKSLKEKIEAIRRKAAQGVQEVGRRIRVEGLFPGWQVDFSPWPDILASADLRVLSAGELPWRGWDRKPGKGLFSLDSGDGDFPGPLSRPWILRTNLDGRFAASFRVRVRFCGSSPPAWILLSFQGVHACLVRPSGEGRGEVGWSSFLSSGPEVVNKPAVFLERAWAAWAGEAPKVPLLAGCLYTLEIRLGPREGRSREVTFLLDGKPVLPPRMLPVKKPARGTAELRVQGKIQVIRVTLQGRPAGGRRER